MSAPSVGVLAVVGISVVNCVPSCRKNLDAARPCSFLRPSFVGVPANVAVPYFPAASTAAVGPSVDDVLAATAPGFSRSPAVDGSMLFFTPRLLLLVPTFPAFWTWTKYL